MRLRYTPLALAELDEILEYIVQRSPKGARRVHLRIRHIVDLVAERPHIGAQADASGLRRVATTPFPYLVFYQVSEAEVVIVGIRHAARDPDTMPDRQ